MLLERNLMVALVAVLEGYKRLLRVGYAPIVRYKALLRPTFAVRPISFVLRTVAVFSAFETVRRRRRRVKVGQKLARLTRGGRARR